ncbi:unnamed protein product [Bursaphelenchus okinawaensis]|uniref:Uncharacterized protein n=1 Tax=Bursaphelenchus okinawaensis TaxID=465554 RepID=A0A811LSA4_9BILA|nr:unnamed protein product [Bursaphelenchus okinawaensis]CAG9127381.1 unnamed protein product [Bursaphelenchus okinawaensis]
MSQNDRSVNQKFSDMRLNVEGRALDESYSNMMDSFDGDEAIPAVKIEKNEPPLLHKNFYRDFIDPFDPYNKLK